MPPKKRGRPSSSAAQGPTKRVRVAEASVIGTQNALEGTESGRAKRSSVGEPNYNLTRVRAPNAKHVGETARASSSKTSPAGKGMVKRKRKRASALFGKRRTSTTPKAEAAVKATESPKRKPGRPKAGRAPSLAAGGGNTAATPTKGRGRPKKVVKEVISTKDAGLKRKGFKVSGHGSKAKAKQTDILPNGSADDVDDGEETETSESGRQYWLMKAEPESRVENGVDVKFSIDDLRARGEAEAWDGVRNHAARNNMRAMRVGDQAFFYHSNCKVPGIAGIMEIVAEHAVDETAFDPAHPYHDPKSSRENPKWDVVYVQYVRKFPEIIKLTDLRSFAKTGGALEKMQLLKQGRLSVSAVKPKEWAFILSLAGDETDEPSGATAMGNGNGGINGTKGSRENVMDEEAKDANDEDDTGDNVNGDGDLQDDDGEVGNKEEAGVEAAYGDANGDDG